jgi:hypothetical protein
MKQSSIDDEICDEIGEPTDRFDLETKISDEIGGEPSRSCKIALSHIVECYMPIVVSETLHEVAVIQQPGFRRAAVVNFDDIAESQ